LALFFDAGWFSKRLAALNLQREDMARATGWTPEELAWVFKDQKEVTAREVEVLSALLHASPGEIANRCGISTPVTEQPLSATAQIDHLQKRVVALEAHVAALEAALRSR
jgi:hypothetical protein